MSNVYRQVSLPEGHGSTRIVATHINWESVGADPAVIGENSLRIKGRVKIEKGEPDYEPTAIVAFGPSLADTYSQLSAFKRIYTCSGAHKFLLERGITPTYHVDSDPRAYKADILGEPNRDVQYLLASICHPTYFDKLELHGCDVKLWHMLFLEPHIWVHFPTNEAILTSGHTVGPWTAILARVMGHANLHFFGFDASAGTGDKTHVTQHPNPPRDLEWIQYDGRYYLTNRNWEDHAAILLKDFDRMPEVRYTFYGDGLMQHMARRHVPVKRASMPLRVWKTEKGECVW